MVRWIYCKCGKIVDEFESKCHWCGRPLTEEEKDWDGNKTNASESRDRQLELF